jgi:hypothetical protein
MDHINENETQVVNPELFEILANAEDDVRSGRTAPMKESFEELKKRLSERMSIAELPPSSSDRFV